MRISAFLFLACAIAAADTVVLEDGTVLRGAVEKSGNGIRVGGRTAPLDEVLLWENEEGVARNAPTAKSHYLAFRAIANQGVVDKSETLLERAVAAGDGETARLLLERAEKAGIEAKRAEEWSAKIEKLDGEAKSGVDVPGDEDLVALLLDRARKNMDGDELRAMQLLRYALDLDPEHAGAKEYLEEIAPRRWRLGDKRNWLEWKVEVLPGVRLLKRRSPDLQRAKTFWGRKDLVGLETEHMILITPLPDPRPIHMCLELGGLTVAALDAMFKVDAPKRDEFLPLVVYFYENKKEYVERSNRGMGGGPSATLGLTAGFYTPAENISRFFWPNHPGAAKSVRDTFVHELTHHWIERRNPRWHERDMAGPGERTLVPGYWVVEGFATFIQHSRFDREKKTWTHFNNHALSLDVVAAVSKAKQLLKWDMVYTLTQAKFHGELVKTATKAQATVKGRWSIRPHPISSVRLFYEQSSATCMFLYWGEKGAYRQKLLDYVTAYYTSKPERTKIDAALGLSPEQLGEKVEKFAIDVIYNGYRPDKE